MPFQWLSREITLLAFFHFTRLSLASNLLDIGSRYIGDIASQKSIQENGYQGPLGVFRGAIKDAQAYQNGKEKEKSFPLIYSLRKKETFRKYHSINKTCLRESYIIRNMPNKSHGKQSLRMKANLCWTLIFRLSRELFFSLVEPRYMVVSVNEEKCICGGRRI